MFRSNFWIAGALALGVIAGIGSLAHADENHFDGPRQGKGIANETLGEIDLGKEIEGMEGRSFRMRYWTVEPGGMVPVHSHKDRPAMIYFLEGEIVQHRSDRDEPEVFGPGDVSIESDGVVHWWENTGDVTVKMIAIDIYKDSM